MTPTQPPAETRPFNPDKPFLPCVPSGLSLFDDARVAKRFHLGIGHSLALIGKH